MIKKHNIFSINFHSDIDGADYEGQFTSRKMSMMDRSKINVKKSQLNGGMYTCRDDNGKPTGLGIDEETEFLNYVIAYLDIVLIQKPAWWNLSEIADHKLLMKVFEEAMNFENSFRIGKPGDNPSEIEGSVQSGQGSGSTQHTASIDGNTPKKVVDPKIQAALDA